MSNRISNFRKSKDFLVCVDSDGCVFDTMDSKHILCFGPSLLEEWDFAGQRDAVVNRWNGMK